MKKKLRCSCQRDGEVSAQSAKGKDILKLQDGGFYAKPPADSK